MDHVTIEHAEPTLREAAAQLIPAPLLNPKPINSWLKKMGGKETGMGNAVVWTINTAQHLSI